MGEKILHYRFRSLFPDSRVAFRLEDGIQRAGLVFETTSQLIKLFCLDTFAELSTKHTSFGKDFVTDFSTIIDLSPTFFANAFSVASSEVSPGKKKGRPFKDNRLPQALDACYARYASQNALPSPKPNGSNLSHVLSYMKVQIRTAYNNNVFLHFDKYVKRYVSLKLKSSTFASLDGKGFKTLLNKVYRLLLYETTVNIPELNHTIGDPLVQDFLSVLPVHGKDRFLHMQQHPEVYLPYMIHLNILTEEAQGKLLNPCPTRSSFVTGHVTIDTAALIDMVVDPSGIPLAEFLLLMEERLGVSFPAGMDKGKLYGNPCLLFPSTDSKLFPADFKSHVWNVLCAMGKKRCFDKERNLKFNNLVTTNGYKVDAHYVPPEHFHLDRYKGDKTPKPQEDPDFQYVHRLPAKEREKLLALPSGYADPGKGNIVYLSDGIKGGNRLRYTAAQRRFETSQKRNAEELEKMLLYKGEDGTTYKSLVEALAGNNDSSRKSCCLGPYTRYLALRLEISVHLRPFYQRTGHRRRQYRALLGRKSSEDRLCNNIAETFGGMVIFWGNWGRNPNLKHQPPTPGIGLRRQVHKRFQTYTYDERMSSSLCFTCESPVSHPFTRSYRRVNRSGVRVEVTISVHHLLRCENEKCTSRWWERDNLGSLNGMKITNYALRHGKPHPVFSGSKKSSATSRKRKQTAAKPTKPGSDSSTKRFTAGVAV